MADGYRKETTEVVSLLATDAESGLPSAEAQRRLAEHGPNELVERGLKSPWRILWEQLTGLMVVILIISAVVSGLLGDWKDAIAILAIVVLNAVLGFGQEFGAEKAMAPVKQLAVPTVKVRRNGSGQLSGGQVVEISARDLVPGDVVSLEAGALAPVKSLSGSNGAQSPRLLQPGGGALALSGARSP